MDNKTTWKKFILRWLCGFQDSSEADNERAKEWENKLSSLEQDTRAKRALYSLLLIILCFGVALYLFWSLWTYSYPYGGSRLTDYCNATVEFTI